MGDDHGVISFVVSAPGKVILFGEHSVVYKKAAVSTSIGKRLYVTITSNTKENIVLVNFPQINTRVLSTVEKFGTVLKEKIPLQNEDALLSIDKPDIINHGEFVKSIITNIDNLGFGVSGSEKTRAALIGFLYVMRGMCHSLKSSLIPFSLEITSDLEVGAGTGSSAAFAVAMAGSILLFRKHLESQNTTTNILQDKKESKLVKSQCRKSGFSTEEKNIINKWAFCIEKIMHGHPSGIDNTTCTFGSVVVTSQERNGTGELSFSFLENIPKISILLISTGVSRNTAHLVKKVRQLRESHCSAIDAILNAMDVIAKDASKTLDDLGACSSNVTKSAELYHVLSGLMELNHGLLRTLGVSHESLEHIVSVSKRHGLATKLTGAGGGGYAITLVPPNFPKSHLEELKKELGSNFKVTEINIAEEGIRLEKAS